MSEAVKPAKKAGPEPSDFYDIRSLLSDEGAGDPGSGREVRR